MRYFIYELSNPEDQNKYIGVSKNPYKRYVRHRHNCKNPNSEKHHLFVYEYIRNNGGFDDWKMRIVEEIETDDKSDAYSLEKAWIRQCPNLLNSIR